MCHLRAACVCSGGGGGLLSGLQLAMPSGALRRAPCPAPMASDGNVGSGVGAKNVREGTLFGRLFTPVP